jgi:hypothetical protein
VRGVRRRWVLCVLWNRERGSVTRRRKADAVWVDLEMKVRRVMNEAPAAAPAAIVDAVREAYEAQRDAQARDLVRLYRVATSWGLSVAAGLGVLGGMAIGHWVWTP